MNENTNNELENELVEDGRKLGKRLLEKENNELVEDGRKLGKRLLEKENLGKSTSIFDRCRCKNNDKIVFKENNSSTSKEKSGMVVLAKPKDGFFFSSNEKKTYPITEMNTSNYTLEKNGVQLFEVTKDQDLEVWETLKILRQNCDLDDVDDVRRSDYVHTLGTFSIVDNKLVTINEHTHDKESDVLKNMKQFTLRKLKEQPKYANKNIDLIPLHEAHYRNAKNQIYSGIIHSDNVGIDLTNEPADILRVAEQRMAHMFADIKDTLSNSERTFVEIVNTWGILNEDEEEVTQDLLGFLLFDSTNSNIKFKFGHHENIYAKKNLALLQKDSDLKDPTLVMKSKMKFGDILIFKTDGMKSLCHQSVTMKLGGEHTRKSFELRWVIELL